MRVRLLVSGTLYFLAPLLGLVLLISCSGDSSTQQRYYYSTEGLDSNLPDTLSRVNIEDDKAVMDFIKGKTFVSKTEKLIIDDQLMITYLMNGRQESVMKGEITEYLVHNERLLLFRDTTHSSEHKFTLSTAGILTDMRTYSLYSVQK